MSFAPAPHPWLGTGPDRNADSEASGKFPRPTHLPISVSYQPPLHLFSQQIPSESGPVMDVSAARSDLEQVVHKSMVYEYTHRDRDDCCDGWRFSPSMCAHNEGIPGLGLPLSPSHSLRGKLDEPFPKFQPFGTIYTDDARMKLGNGIHRLCFNCRAIETKTWRRSRLNPGKMLCNKCGLFERTHAIPRPKTFPRRRRSRFASVHQSSNIPPNIDRYHDNERPPIMAITGPTLHALNSTVGGEKISQHASWMNHNMPDVSWVPSCVSPCPTDTPKPYCTDFQLPLTIPPQYASQYVRCYQPM